MGWKRQVILNILFEAWFYMTVKNGPYEGKEKCIPRAVSYTHLIQLNKSVPCYIEVT